MGVAKLQWRRRSEQLLSCAFIRWASDWRVGMARFALKAFAVQFDSIVGLKGKQRPAQRHADMYKVVAIHRRWHCKWHLVQHTHCPQPKACCPT